MLIPHFLVLLVCNVLNGAGSGNRTHLSSLEGWSFTDIRYPHILYLVNLDYYLTKLVGVTGIEPATSWSQTTRAPICATPRYKS